MLNYWQTRRIFTILGDGIRVHMRWPRLRCDHGNLELVAFKIILARNRKYTWCVSVQWKPIVQKCTEWSSVLINCGHLHVADSSNFTWIVWYYLERSQNKFCVCATIWSDPKIKFVFVQHKHKMWFVLVLHLFFVPKINLCVNTNLARDWRSVIVRAGRAKYHLRYYI